MKPLIQLDASEIMRAAITGVGRQMLALKNGMHPAHGSGDKNDWQIHIEGALGEEALSKFLGVYNGNCFTRGAPDVGEEEEVRTRTGGDRPRQNDLIVRHSDHDDRRYWLLIGRNGTYVVHGFIYGRDAKQEKWLYGYGDRPKSFFVPQEALTL